MLLALLLAFTAFTGWLLGRRIFRPLNRLRVASRRIAEGRLETRLGWSRRDELGALAHDFDEMAGELEESHGRLEDLALRDPLTGLANHRRFQEALSEATARADAEGNQLALIILDIDRFKRINDAWGHPAGDQVLARRAAAWRTRWKAWAWLRGWAATSSPSCCPTPTRPRRSPSARPAGPRWRAARPATWRSRARPGLAIFPDDGTSPDSLTQLADGALYWAKRSGRDLSRRYDPEHVLVVTSEQRSEFAQVLESPDAITPVFQPIVSLETGEILAYEALARFEDGRRRPPTWWFAQAHRFGLGAKLEAEAIRAAIAAPDRPRHLSLSVNVSPSALSSPEVRAVLPERLDNMIFEITEQEQIIHPHELQQTLQPLRERGARVAVDDAGAGYAGLQQIMRMKADFIKLDRALISDVHLDQAKAALIGSLVDFAASTGAEVCAEGIETLDELRVLIGLGVRAGRATGSPAPRHRGPRSTPRRRACAARWLARRAGPVRTTSRPSVPAALPHSVDRLRENARRGAPFRPPSSAAHPRGGRGDGRPGQQGGGGAGPALHLGRRAARRVHRAPGRPAQARGRDLVSGRAPGRARRGPAPDRAARGRGGDRPGPDVVELVGALPPVGTFVTGYRVYPFVGTIPAGARGGPRRPRWSRCSSCRCPT